MYLCQLYTPAGVTEVVVATLVTTTGLLEVDSEAGWLAVVGEWGEGAGDVCSCALISLVEEVMTDHGEYPLSSLPVCPQYKRPAHLGCI